jgi:hypothetical protein
VVIALLLLAGCDEDPCPRGSMLDGEAGLLVTEAEHPTGWGQRRCVGCHALEQTHTADCTPEVDLDGVRDLVWAEGAASCASCHGTNGETP